MLIQLDPITRLAKDLKEASRTLSQNEARFLVDAYYSMQDQRKRTDNQVRALTESGEPCEVIDWYAAQSFQLEKQVARALDAYSASQPLGERIRTVVGIGPVIAAGLLAHVNFERAKHAGNLWSFAGLANKEWRKGEKRPWNADLKTLCWKIGESFVKVSGNEGAYYGKVYKERKAHEIARNEAGDLANEAERVLTEKRFRSDTVAKRAYESGKLPDGHLHARAKRYAVKLFLSHFFEVGYALHHGIAPPRPYAFDILGHSDYLEPPF